MQTRLGRQAFFVAQGHRRTRRFLDASVEHAKHAPHEKERNDHQNREANHEPGDVYISGIARFVVGLSILMIVSFFLMWGMFRVFAARFMEPPRSPMALAAKERLPP